MKNIITTTLCMLMLLVTQQGHSQFGDLLKQVKDAVVKDDPSKQLPPVYAFDYEYHMESEYKGKVDKYVFLMKEDASVVAIVEGDKDETNIMLWDHSIKKAKLYMIGKDSGGKGMVGIPYIDMANLADKMKEKNEDKYSIIPTGKTKTIAGFKCKEFKTSDKKNTGYVYVTTDAGIIGFNLVGFSDLRMPKSVANMQGLQDGLLMELSSRDKNKPKKNAITMRCVKLVESNYTIDNTKFQQAN